MSDKYSIDSQKLHYHPTRISQWYEAKDDWNRLKSVYPVFIEISPIGGCNHRCTFCAMDYMGYRNIKWDEKVLADRLTEMSKLGVKSINFAGEGEPLLYKPLARIVEHSSNVGLDTSITSNFVPTNKESISTFVKNCSWIKISFNAGTANTYAQIHQTSEKDFDIAVENMRYAVEVKKETGSKCTLGAQMLLLPENRHEAVTLAKMCQEIGIDYLVIKPYSQHLSSETTIYKDIVYDDMLSLEDELEALNTEKFNVVFRSNTMKKHSAKTHTYKKCLSTPFFWAYVSTEGDVYGCSAYLGKENFRYGNLNENGFQEIWESEKRQKSYRFVQDELDISECRTNCRMDEVNKYLDRLIHPNDHDNFI